MALQLPQQFNQLNAPAIENARQQREWNALRQEAAQREYSEDERIDNTKWGAGAAKLGLDLLTKDPESFRQYMPQMIEEGQRRGIWEDFPNAPQTAEQAAEGFENMLQTFMMGLAGEPQEERQMAKDVGGYQRFTDTGERAFPDAVATPGTNATIPAKIQQAEWWLRSNPEQRAGYMSANYAGSVQDIGGVPHWVMPGGDSLALSTIQDEKGGAAEIALAEGEGGRGRLETPSGEFEAVPGTEADIKQKERERKRAGGAFMKSIQAQTVVEDVFRLNEQLDSGTVPFGRLAKVQQDLHPSLQSEGYRNANSLIESVKGNVGIDSLLRIKATGAGLGQVPQSQLDLLSRLLGELDLGQEEAQFRYTWNRMGRVYESILTQAEDDLIELGLVSPDVAQISNADSTDDFQAEWDAAESGTKLQVPDGTWRVKP